MNLTWIISLIGVGLVVYVISVYNDLAAFKTRIKASIQEIGNQLKRQAELIPNLEESAKAYLAHEKGLIKLLADARKLVAAGEDASAKVAEILPRLQVVMESNPQIKGADVVTSLMDELRDTSDKVMYSRRSMIDIVADYNVKVVTFPANIIANAFGFGQEKGLETPMAGEHLRVSDADLKASRVKLN